MRTSPLGVTNLAKDFTIEKLARMVEEAQTEKADTQRFLDHAEQFYAVGVILLTIALIVAPPCALIISNPGFHFVRDRHGPAWRVVQRWRTSRTRSNDEGRGLRQTGTLTETRTRPRVTDLIVDRRVVNFLSEPDASAVALLQLVGAGRGQIRALAQTIVTESKQRGQVSEECAAFNPLLAKARAAL